MKVAAVGILCQDIRVFRAMLMAGTPCPYEGRIGMEAKASWDANPKDRPDYVVALDRYLEKCRGSLNNAGQKKSKRTCVKEFNKGS